MHFAVEMSQIVQRYQNFFFNRQFVEINSRKSQFEKSI
jgi:hypothetical protein